MRKPLRFIAAIMMSAAAMTSYTPLFAQKLSVLDSSASVDYTVNRLVPYDSETKPARSAQNMPVPEDQWQAFRQMIADAKERFETINRNFGAYCWTRDDLRRGEKLRKNNRNQRRVPSGVGSYYQSYQNRQPNGARRIQSLFKRAGNCQHDETAFGRRLFNRAVP